MTYKQAVRKKFLLWLRVWHHFNTYAREYEKTLTPEQKITFRKFFGE